MDRKVPALVLLFLASVISTDAQSEPPAPVAAPAPAPVAVAGVPLQPVFYDVGRNLSLRCPLPKEADQNYVWSKNGTNIASLKEVSDRFDVDHSGAVLTAKGRAQEDDFGNYTCTAGDASYGWEVRGKTHVKLPQNTNVVQEQKVKMSCKVIGKPYPQQVTWLYWNGSEPAVNRSAYLELADREGVKLQDNEQGVQFGEIVIERAQPSDAGEYMCLVEYTMGDVLQSANATTVLRVKDMYAALWPFLGICAEVLVLCAIILVYEKRRTKPDLDDSDTDNHDQKKS